MTKLGFHAPLTRLYVFVRNEGNCLWYFLEDGQKRYIMDSALTGVIKGFEVKQSETSFGSELKADFEVVADRRYVLRSGVESAFTKGLLMIVNSLSDEQLRRPLTLELKAGEKNNVLVSARDPETFEPVRSGTWENANWESLMESAIARLGGSPQPQSHPQLQSPPQPQSSAPQTQTITQQQYQDLLSRAKQTGYSTAGFAELLGKYKFSRGGEITQKAYPQLWAECCDRVTAQSMNLQAEAESEAIRH